MKKLNDLLDYFKFLKNPITALMFKFGLKKECEIKLKNSPTTVKLTSVFALNRLMNAIPYTNVEKYEELIKYIKDIDNDEEIISIDGINYYNIFNEIFKKKHAENFSIHIEEFITDDSWNTLDMNNRNIIDIGANIGDTALYFAKNGANVIAFEPVKHLYELGVETLHLNQNLEKKIKLINKAVGGKRGKLDIEASSAKAYANDSYQIEVITVADILNDYNFPADVLKMDCEGCEFKIILNEDLTMFKDIIFEHHSKLVGKDYKPLIEKLKKDGFTIDTYPVTITKQSFKEIGIIHAYK